MRSCALITLAACGVIALTLPAAAQNSVSVTKQSAPQFLAPAQDEIPAPAPQPSPQAQAAPPAPAGVVSGLAAAR